MDCRVTVGRDEGKGEASPWTLWELDAEGLRTTVLNEQKGKKKQILMHYSIKWGIKPKLRKCRF